MFISNAGQECQPLGIRVSGGPNRLYNQFYAALKSWGKYELLPAPSGADLVLQLHFTCPPVGEKQPDEAQLKLLILDTQTHVILWAFNEHVEPALLQYNFDKNFDRTVVRVVDHVKSIAAGIAP